MIHSTRLTTQGIQGTLTHGRQMAILTTFVMMPRKFGTKKISIKGSHLSFIYKKVQDSFSSIRYLNLFMLLGQFSYLLTG